LEAIRHFGRLAPHFWEWKFFALRTVGPCFKSLLGIALCGQMTWAQQICESLRTVVLSQAVVTSASTTASGLVEMQNASGNRVTAIVAAQYDQGHCPTNG
jgi:hypothetical protein